jgi:hypothetical protein
MPAIIRHFMHLSQALSMVELGRKMEFWEELPHLRLSIAEHK